MTTEPWRRTPADTEQSFLRNRIMTNRPFRQTKAKDACRAAEASPGPALLRSKDAAVFLAISPRKLWELANRGEIPAIRFDRVVRFDVADLRKWIEAQKKHQ